jgi:hypothetical protein
MFSISFLPNNTDQTSLVSSEMRLGRIVIGDFSEQFESSLSYWDINKYQENWKKGIERLLRGESKSCIITSMYNPKAANFISWWLMYSENRIVYFQNQLLFLKKLKIAFNPEDPYILINDRETVSENNIPISEWEVPLEALEEFLLNGAWSKYGK